MDIDFDHIAANLSSRGSAELITPDSVRAAEVPQRWHEVVNGIGAADRIQVAMSYWEEDFLAMIPGFAHALRERLIDVRVFWVDTSRRRFYVLVYVVKNNTDGYVCWMAWDPARCGEAPRFWDTFPAPVQSFLRHTHAGFTAPDRESCGIMQPCDFETFAEYAGWPEGVPGWMDGYEDGFGIGYHGEKYKRIESTRLVMFTKDSGELFYCTSPDLQVGQVALVYDGDVDPPKDFGTELDELMIRSLDVT